MAKYKVGAVVYLKSGGPAMTVTAVINATNSTNQTYNTAWFDGPKSFNENFPEEALTDVRVYDL